MESRLYFEGADFYMRSPEEKTYIYEEGIKKCQELIAKIAPGKRSRTKNTFQVYCKLRKKCEEILTMLSPSNQWIDDSNEEGLRIEDIRFVPINRLYNWHAETAHAKSLVFDCIRTSAQIRFEEFLVKYSQANGYYNIDMYKSEMKTLKAVKKPTADKPPMLVWREDKYVADYLDIISEMKRRNDIIACDLQKKRKDFETQKIYRKVDLLKLRK